MVRSLRTSMDSLDWVLPGAADTADVGLLNKLNTLGGGPWACSTCSYGNNLNADAQFCCMCGSPRPRANSASSKARRSKKRSSSAAASSSSATSASSSSSSASASASASAVMPSASGSGSQCPPHATACRDGIMCPLIGTPAGDLHCLAYWHPSRDNGDIDFSLLDSPSEPEEEEVQGNSTGDYPPAAKKSRSSSVRGLTSDSGDTESSDEEGEKGGVNRYSLGYIAERHEFGPAAFGPLKHEVSAGGRGTAAIASSVALPAGAKNLHAQVPSILAAAMPSIRSMRGERGNKTVQRMLSDIYATGLHMHHPPTSPINSQASKHTSAFLDVLQGLVVHEFCAYRHLLTH